jgi:hypothetical protein
MRPSLHKRKGKRQRFYARNAVNTTLLCVRAFDAAVFGRRIGPFLPFRPNPSQADKFRRRVLRHRGPPVRPCGGCGVVWHPRHPKIDLAAASPPQGWSLADWSYSAFALSPPDAADKTEKPDTYVTLRHPGGGRKDILRWSRSGEKPAAELEIYRPGSEYGPASAARAELAARLMAGGTELEAAGVIASKFGSVALLRPAGEREGSGSCLGFLTRIDDPVLQMSGWSCQGDSLPARRAAIDCMLNRLVLLASGNEAKLADAFARAELNRGACASATVSADWMTEAANPGLRGAF